MVKKFFQIEEEKKESKWERVVILAEDLQRNGLMIFVIGLIYIGALANFGGMSVTDYKGNISQNLEIVKDTGVNVLTNFYQKGMEHPTLWIILFILTCLWFVFWLVWDIMKIIKNKGGKK